MAIDGGCSGGDGGRLEGSRKKPVGFTFFIGESLLVRLRFLRHFSHGDVTSDPELLAIPKNQQVKLPNQCINRCLYVRVFLSFLKRDRQLEIGSRQLSG